MSADGSWTITVNSPMGAQKSTVKLATQGGALTGETISRQGESQAIYDGTVEGEAVAWKLDITAPLPMTLTFEGKVSGDSVSGHVKAGTFGSFPFSGERA